MLIILATREDETAEWLVNRWQEHNAVHVSAADLSGTGWCLQIPPNGKSGGGQAGGRKVRNEEIDGVLIRTPRIYGQELNHIVPSDRQYVASEMTAFLVAWLSSLECPVLNRPTPDCLGGPGWRAEEWVYFASRLGIASSDICRGTSDPEGVEANRPHCEIVVVRDECFGDAAPFLTKNAHMLARAAGTELLAVRFTSPDADGKFMGASLWPNLTSPEVADAVLRCLHGRFVC